MSDPRLISTQVTCESPKIEVKNEIVSDEEESEPKPEVEKSAPAVVDEEIEEGEEVDDDDEQSRINDDIPMIESKPNIDSTNR